MKVRNVHERSLDVPAAEVGRLIDRLGSAADRIWPSDRWPPMRLHRGLEVGSRGGHGPVRYSVEAYEAGKRVQFRFEAPRGLDGTHTIEVEASGDGAVLRHVLEADATGAARLTWPLFFRPLHDALLEDALDRAAAATGTLVPARRESRTVALLRGAGQLVQLGRRVARWSRSATAPTS